VVIDNLEPKILRTIKHDRQTYLTTRPRIKNEIYSTRINVYVTYSKYYLNTKKHIFYHLSFIITYFMNNF
jgi:hypothetical protein